MERIPNKQEIQAANSFEELDQALDNAVQIADSKGRTRSAEEIKDLIRQILEAAEVFERDGDRWGASSFVARAGITSNLGLRDKVVELIKRKYKFAA